MALVNRVVTEDEETIKINKDDITKVDNVWSFESESTAGIRWSTLPFSDKNSGGSACRFGERVFSKPHTIYFKTAHNCSIHIRTIQL